ncbi:uncharacterized protein LOC135214107 [Macrobrachium nipponense]|uniref:uncharacterized protein LOC135214107 n=1 Tax=Macrobrachium nipponense TaxID=159736 RepID=UPI0030C84D7E
MTAPERRGSVTVILQNASSYCLVTSPREPTKLQPDCWDEGAVRREEENGAPDEAAAPEGGAPDGGKRAAKRDPQSSSPTKSKTQGKRKEEPTRVRSSSSSSSPSSAKRKEEDVGKRGAGEGNLRKQSLKKRIKEDPQEESSPVADQYEKVYDLMVGRSEVYSQVVEALRKSCGKSKVLLGLPDSPKEQIVLREFSLDENVHRISRSSFTVAVAAAKMRLHYERALALRAKSKRHDRGRHGKKVFEDAFVTTWSQPILSASKQGFSITFEKAKKPRIVRVSKLRRKSVALELPKPAEDDAPREEAEWVEWRRVHDSVTNWLADNSKVEPDESHIITMLMEADQKKSIFLK